jgi:hypothetical protein
MSTRNEAKARAIAEQWMATVLPDEISGAGGTGVYRHPAPEQAIEPFITVNIIVGRIVRPLGRGKTGVVRLNYDVSAWDQGLTAERVDALAVAAANALELTGPVTVPGGQIVACKNTGPVAASGGMVERGKHYQRNGNLYEVMVKVD